MLHDAYLDKGMRGHLVNLAKKHMWRLAKNGYDFDDMLQEAMIVYTKCHNHYVGKKPKKRPDGTPRRLLPKWNPDQTAIRHFMRLVQRSYKNHILSLAAKYAGGREVPMADLLRPDQLEDQVWDQLMPPDYEVASVTTLIQNAPREVKQLIQLLVYDALEFSGYRRATKVNKSGDVVADRRGMRETNNQRYCRLLGLPQNYDLVGQVERYFLG